MATVEAAGVRGGPSPLEPTSSPATNAGREAAATAKDMATAAAQINTSAWASQLGTVASVLSKDNTKY
jgi:hypothetical protein